MPSNKKSSLQKRYFNLLVILFKFVDLVSVCVFESVVSLGLTSEGVFAFKSTDFLLCNINSGEFVEFSRKHGKYATFRQAYAECAAFHLETWLYLRSYGYSCVPVCITYRK